MAFPSAHQLVNLAAASSSYPDALQMARVLDAYFAATEGSAARPTHLDQEHIVYSGIGCNKPTYGAAINPGSHDLAPGGAGEGTSLSIGTDLY
ncbi:hypothetical protein MAPG_06028 [Magnaporthiopsis poae ATCC 64411]|uniref:Uncharacterized protein n=1 Tax=Magnaporthiopsis poae (strain ATCC 64411 / 73-15) TaxID=644358 RepID=A0A0C4E0Y6_MAGP6|nr:hypothetical protein MAPG_06028 [Magnaporthiopsis poae ATCC 64411]